MTDLFTFHKTVRGYAHVKKGTVCEDASASYTCENGKYQVAVVCDGHGDTSCFRSSQGSAFAVNCAMTCLRDFAEALINESQLPDGKSLRDRLLVKREQIEIVRHLTDSILSKWNEAVEADLSEHPPTEEELQSAGRYCEQYKRGERMPHIYGTTLIAALRVENILLMLQQGDGRCEVIFSDGHMEQPVPWDARCHENVTTSLCDEDADVSFRHCVLNLTDKAVAAIYLGSDGVEDSYINNDDQSGTHVFWGNLSAELVRRDAQSFNDYLESYLPQFSKEGSGDDISVSGIVDQAAIAALIPRLEEFGKKYELREALLLTQRKLDSMDRKHQLLRKKSTDAAALLSKQKTMLDAEQSKMDELIRLQSPVESSAPISSQPEQDNAQSSSELRGEAPKPEPLSGATAVDNNQLAEQKQIVDELTGRVEKLTQESNRCAEEYNSYHAIFQQLLDKKESFLSALDNA